MEGGVGLTPRGMKRSLPARDSGSDTRLAQPSLLTYQAGVQPLKAPQGLQDFVRDKAGLLCPSQNHAQWARGRQFGPPPWDIWPRGDFF